MRAFITIVIVAMALASHAVAQAEEAEPNDEASDEQNDVEDDQEEQSSPDIARRIDVETNFVYSYSGRHGFGGQIAASHGWRVWETRYGSGIIDLGLAFSYEGEPYSLSNKYLGEAVASGGAHRFETLLVVGHTIRIPPQRRIIFSIQLYGGWVHTVMRGHIDNERYDISRDYRTDAGTFSTGLSLGLGLSVTDRASIIFRVRAPFPYSLSPITAYAFGSLGVSIRFP